jgi:hypothetical protein
MSLVTLGPIAKCVLKGLQQPTLVQVNVPNVLTVIVMVSVPRVNIYPRGPAKPVHLGMSLRVATKTNVLDVLLGRTSHNQARTTVCCVNPVGFHPLVPITFVTCAQMVNINTRRVEGRAVIVYQASTMSWLVNRDATFAN